MFKKIFVFLVLLVGVFLISCSQNSDSKKTTPVASGNIDILTSSRDTTDKANYMWVGTFPLIWDELKEKYIGDDVEFTDGAAKTILDNLNTEPFDKTEISEEAYYLKSSKVVNEALKKEIADGIKDKFNENSDILDDFDWTDDDNALFLYAMLKKDFKFINEFTKLQKDKFNGGTKNVEYFGINADTKKEVHSGVTPLFYENENEYAVVLATEGGDEVILYRTDAKKTLYDYYDTLNAKENYEDFNNEDTLKIPVIKLNEKKEFTELENHTIKGTNLAISKAIETVKFNMDEKGVSLKSEAGMMIAKASFNPEIPDPRDYNFDKSFVLFLKETDAEMPYFMMRVEDDAIF